MKAIANFADAVCMFQSIRSFPDPLTSASADKLGEAYKAILCLLALQVKSHLNLGMFEKPSLAFPNQQVPTWKVTNSRAVFLSDCSENSCCC
jgi:hypothetical protein